MNRLVLSLSLIVLLHRSVTAADPPITFPSDGGVLDVREFGAKADDGADDTAAIQKALDQHPNGNRIIYLPPGTWLVRETLRWPQGERGGLEQKRTILQGAGQSLTVLQLPDAAPGFTDATQPKPLIWTGNKPAQRFRNGGRLWILGMKTEKIGTIIETLNGGVTDAAGIFIYSNQGWDEKVPAFIIHNSTVTLAGINERNFNQKPVSLWFRETQHGETRESKDRAWVYLSAP